MIASGSTASLQSLRQMKKAFSIGSRCALIHGARELKEHGTFGFAAEVTRSRDLRALLTR